MRCSEYIKKEQCGRTAALYLLHPDGSRNPGGWVCREHGEVILSEYSEKLGEIWKIEEMEEVEKK